MESYLIRNYQWFVLRPELRNPVIELGISQILADAHLRYLAVLTTIDDRVQDFLRRHTRHLEALDPLAKLGVSLGWDAQQWKAPRYAVNDEAFRAAFKGTGAATVSALVATGVRPTIERTIGPVFANVAVRVVGAMRPQIVGVAAGSLIEPGLGSLAGWAIGVGAVTRKTFPRFSGGSSTPSSSIYCRKHRWFCQRQGPLSVRAVSLIAQCRDVLL